MTVLPFELTVRSGTEAVVRYSRLRAGDSGQPFEPGAIVLSPGANPTSFGDLTVGFVGEGIPSSAIRLKCSDDLVNWHDALATSGDRVSAANLNCVKHVDASQARFFAPVVFDDADPALSVSVEIHLCNRP